MAQTYNLNELIPTSVSTSFEKRLENELVIGKLARTQYENGRKHGDEIDIIMPGRVTMSNWDGGDLTTVEKVKSSIVKVKIDQGKQVNFELEKDKEIQIQQANQDVAAKLVAEYSSDAIYQSRDAVDAYLGSLYAMAGVKEDNSGSAISLDASHADRCFTILANVKAKFSRYNTWKTNEMIAILPPEMIAIMLNIPFSQYTESQVKDKVKGELSEKAGWKIVESNNIKTTTVSSSTVYHPLFGIRGESFAAPIQKSLELIPYMRDESLNKAFKGGFIFGGGVPNYKKLGTADVTITLPSYS